MGEYAAMLAFSGIFSTIFLGGYTLPLNFAGLNAAADWAAPAIFFAKTIFIFTLFIWIRATLPRLRYDQLMALGWKNLLPLAVTNFIVVMIWIAATKVYGQAIGWGAVLGCAVLIGAVFANNARRAKIGQQPLMERKITLVDPNKGGA
jgi:NADH-quinone oxidoreductase subunit H